MRSISIRYPVDDPILHRCIAIAMTQKRFLRCSLKALLYDAGLYADLHQELVAAAVDAWRQGYDPDNDFRAIKNLVHRCLYHFLKAHGFHRHWDPHTKKQGKGFCRREKPFPLRFTPSYEFGNNTALMAWCEAYITQALGRDAWQEVMKWTKSRRPEPPRGIVAEAISILKEVFQDDKFY